MSSNDFFDTAGSLINFKTNGSLIVGLRQFNEFFGTSPEICEIIWKLLIGHHPIGGKPIHLLCALLFVKKYQTEGPNKAIMGLDPKTFRKWAWIYQELMKDFINIVRILNHFKSI